MIKSTLITKPIKLTLLGDARRLTHGMVGLATELNGRPMMQTFS